MICDEGESWAVTSTGEGAMARNHPKGPNVPQETRDTGLQPKWERPGSLDGNFPEVEGWQPREIFGSGLSWSKQAPSLQGHKALPVQEQSSQGGGSILLSVPRRHSSDQPSPHPCIRCRARTIFISISEAPPREGERILGIAFTERAGAGRAVPGRVLGKQWCGYI